MLFASDFRPGKNMTQPFKICLYPISEENKYIYENVYVMKQLADILFHLKYFTGNRGTSTRGTFPSV